MKPTEHHANAARFARHHRMTTTGDEEQAVFTALTAEYWNQFGYSERRMAHAALKLYGLEGKEAALRMAKGYGRHAGDAGEDAEGECGAAECRREESAYILEFRIHGSSDRPHCTTPPFPHISV